MVFGEIVLAHFRDGLVDPAKLYVDAPALGALGRVEGSDVYVRTGDRFRSPRPAHPAPRP